jgi:hypothetical protein
MGLGAGELASSHPCRFAPKGGASYALRYEAGWPAGRTENYSIHIEEFETFIDISSPWK